MADLTRTDHRQLALSILDRVERHNHPAASGTRQGLLLEAQLHATLALSAPEAVIVPEAPEPAPEPKRVARGAPRKAEPADTSSTSSTPETETDTAA